MIVLTRYHASDQIEKNEIGRACGMGEDRIDAYRVLVWRPDGKRPLGGPRWKYNIKMDRKKVGWEALDWNFPDQDRDR